ncbi:MAG: hypothetical protein LBL79_12705 [Prevotella sp.]|jgi:hypothetical protein|nr:hypothetical protein [Prevotella sp.]
MKKKLINWSIGVAVTIITGVAITIISERLTDDPVAPLRWLWSWLSKIMSYEAKIWIILLCLGIILLIIWILTKPKKTTKHPFADYTSDTINGDKWVWKWSEYSNHIDSLRMICPEDDTDMIWAHYLDNGLFGLECPRCKHRKSFSNDDVVRLRAIICDNAKKGLRSMHLKDN